MKIILECVDRPPVEREAEEPAQMPKPKVAPSLDQVFAEF